MITREQITEQYPDEKIWFADGYDDAILGIDDDTMRVIYSTKKAMAILFKETKITDAEWKEMKNNLEDEQMTKDEKRMEMAREWFEFNVIGSKGSDLPIWCNDEFYE